MCVSHTYGRGMTTHLETKLEIKSWDEKPYRELDDGQRFTRADVVQAVSDDSVEADVTSESLMFYTADGTATYVGLMRFSGRLGDRSGSFVLRCEGTYDGTHARGTYTVVAGSGTGDLTGLSGTATSVSSQADYPHQPFVFDYDL
jgi:Protein of unknown function (DUF3224)